MASLVPSYDSDEPEGDEQAPACAAVPPPSDAVKKKKAPTTFTGVRCRVGASWSAAPTQACITILYAELLRGGRGRQLE